MQRDKWKSQWIQKRCKNKHSNRHRNKQNDSSDPIDSEMTKKFGKVRDNIDYIKEYNDYSNKEMDIESQLTQIQISNVKTKWNCHQCTYINNKHNILCKICNSSYSSSYSSTINSSPITLIDFMATIKISKSKKDTKNMQKRYVDSRVDPLLQIATQLSLEHNYKNKNIQYNENVIDTQMFENIIIAMNNGQYGKLSIDTKNVFYKYNFLQFLVLPKLKTINKNASDNYSKVKIEFIVKEIVLKRLNFVYNYKKDKNEIKLIYVNHKDLPLLNNMKTNVLFNEKNDEYDEFCVDLLVKLSGIHPLICGYLKVSTDTHVPSDIINLIHLFCNLNPEQLLYKIDANTNISYFKKRKTRIKSTSTTQDAIKILHYNKIAASNKIYLCLLLNNNNNNIVYSDILPILSISKTVKAAKYYGSNNYGGWYTKRTGQNYPSYWNSEYAALFYQVEYQEYYGHI